MECYFCSERWIYRDEGEVVDWGFRKFFFWLKMRSWLTNSKCYTLPFLLFKLEDIYFNEEESSLESFQAHETFVSLKQFEKDLSNKNYDASLFKASLALRGHFYGGIKKESGTLKVCTKCIQSFSW